MNFKIFIIKCIEIKAVTKAINAEKSGVDYLIAGTIFPSNSHPGFPGSGVDLINKITSKVSIPVLGIGGITSENADSVIDNGAFGVAVIGEIMNDSNVFQAAKNLINKVQYCKLNNK